MAEAAELRVVLREEDAVDADLQRAARDMAAQLNAVDGIDATLAEGEAQSGARGVPAEIGAILLKLAESSAVITGVTNVIKAWFERRPDLELVVQTKDGRQVSIKASNVADLQKVLKSVRGVLEG